jgi:hypothetical protein
LFGHFIANAAPLFPADAALNVDDQPLVTFRAPRFVYEKHATSYGRLTNLLASASALDPNERALTKDENFKIELSTYAKARDVFLRGLIEEREGDRDAAVADYIESSRLNPEFTPGYAECLSIASALAGSEREKARTILRQLVEAQPSRPVAREMLRRLE